MTYFLLFVLLFGMGFLMLKLAKAALSNPGTSLGAGKALFSLFRK